MHWPTWAKLMEHGREVSVLNLTVTMMKIIARWMMMMMMMMMMIIIIIIMIIIHIHIFVAITFYYRLSVSLLLP